MAGLSTQVEIKVLAGHVLIQSSGTSSRLILLSAEFTPVVDYRTGISVFF